MCKGGYINATSVGFRIGEAHKNGNGGLTIRSAELLEFSIVSIPSNPHALVQQRSVNADAVRKWVTSNSEIEIDWEAVMKSVHSSSSEIDLSNLVLEGDGPQIDLQLLQLAFTQAAPEIRAVIKEELQVKARLAARIAIEHMTGRLP